MAASAAGTASGTLFLYFPTKQDLVSALVLKIAKDQSEAMNNFVDPSVTAEETFETLWREIIGGITDALYIKPPPAAAA